MCCLDTDTVLNFGLLECEKSYPMSKMQKILVEKASFYSGWIVDNNILSRLVLIYIHIAVSTANCDRSCHLCVYIYLCC